MEQIELKNQYVIYRIKNDVLYAEFVKDSFIDLEAVKKCEKARKVLLKGYSMPMILDFSNTGMITQEAKHYTNTEGYTKGILSVAVLVNTKWKEMLANVYIKFKKSKIPMKTFSNIEEAYSWSQQFVKETVRS